MRDSSRRARTSSLGIVCAAAGRSAKRNQHGQRVFDPPVVSMIPTRPKGTLSVPSNFGLIQSASVSSLQDRKCRVRVLLRTLSWALLSIAHANFAGAGRVRDGGLHGQPLTQRRLVSSSPLPCVFVLGFSCEAASISRRRPRPTNSAILSSSLGRCGTAPRGGSVPLRAPSYQGHPTTTTITVTTSSTAQARQPRPRPHRWPGRQHRKPRRRTPQVGATRQPPRGPFARWTPPARPIW